MSTLLSKTMIACSLALAASLCAASSAFAADQQKPGKAKAAARPHPKAEAVATPDLSLIHI